MDKKILPLLVLAVVLMAVPLAMAQEEVTVYYFYGRGCDNCAMTYPVIEELEERYPQVEFRKYEVWNNPENAALYIDMSQEYGETIVQAARIGSVPMVFIGERYYAGYIQIKSNLENEIKGVLEIDHQENNVIKIPIPFLGEFELNLNAIPIPVLGVVLGLVDGINPCTLSVLLFLLAYLLSLGTKRKVFRVGFFYTLVVFIIYFLFMLGIFGLIAFIGHYSYVKLGVGIIALIVGLLMLKDFFAYGKGISLGISGRAKPTIERLVKRATIPAAIILALFASLVELPCTAGFPLLYTTVMAGQGITGMAGVLYLLWYNIFYIVPLMVLIGLVYFVEMEVERAERWREKSKRWMRLVAGLIMLIMGIAMVMG